MMKYVTGFIFCIVVGCSQPTARPGLYSPEGAYYVATGTFRGTWTDYDMKPDGTWLIEDSDLCTAVVKEADSILIMTITNNTTAEVRMIQGTHFIPVVQCFSCSPSYHSYLVTDSTSLREGINSISFHFADDGNSFEYDTRRSTSNTDSLRDFVISCSRVRK